MAKTKGRTQCPICRAHSGPECHGQLGQLEIVRTLPELYRITLGGDGRQRHKAIELRVCAGLSVCQLANRMGVARSTVERALRVAS